MYFPSPLQHFMLSLFPLVSLSVLRYIILYPDHKIVCLLISVCFLHWGFYCLCFPSLCLFSFFNVQSMWLFVSRFSSSPLVFVFLFLQTFSLHGLFCFVFACFQTFPSRPFFTFFYYVGRLPFHCLYFVSLFFLLPFFACLSCCLLVCF